MHQNWMFSLNEWFPKTKAVLDSVQADIVLACLLLNSTQVLAELGSAQLKLVYVFCNSDFYWGLLLADWKIQNYKDLAEILKENIVDWCKD